MKPKFFFLIIPLFLLSGLLGWWIYSAPSSSLLSPLLSSLKAPNLEDKLTAQITPLPQLDYSTAQTLPSLSPSISYLVYNPNTGRVYFAKEVNKKISPASFTKLLTAQVALDIADPEQLLTASFSSIDKEPTIMELKVGETLPLKDLLRAAIATSANDAAATIAQGTARLYGQNTDFFVSLINKKAKALGMDSSHFANPEGYDHPQQYSTLADVAKAVHNLQENYPLLAEAAVSDREDIAQTATHPRHYLPNWNTLLGLYPGVDGLKIAYTEKAGYSLVVTARRQKIPLVVILTGADSIPERDLAAAALLDAAYLEHNLVPINLTRSQLQPRYNQWQALADKIRQAQNQN